MKRALFSLMSMFVMLLVLSVTGYCQQCNPFTGLCFRPNAETQDLSVLEIQFAPMSPAPMDTVLPELGESVPLTEVSKATPVNRRSFFAGRSRTPVRSLVAGTSQRLKRLRCR